MENNKKRFARIKMEGARAIQLDIDSIRVFEVDFDPEDNEYTLVAYNDSSLFILCSGSFDECHYLLNQLNKLLDVQLIDIQ